MRRLWHFAICVVIVAAGSVALAPAAAPAPHAAPAPGRATVPPNDTEAGQPSGYGEITPSRLLSTSLAPNATTTLQVNDSQRIDSVIYVALNISVTATASGHLTVWAHGSSAALSPDVTYIAGRTVVNAVTVPFTDDRIDITNVSAGPATVVVDRVGRYFGSGARSAGAFAATLPGRVLDTARGLGGSRLGAGRSLRLALPGKGHLPLSNIKSVLLNVTVSGATRAGYLTVYADGTTRPRVLNMDFAAHQPLTTLVVAPLGADGKTVIYNGTTGSLDLAADVVGFFTGGTPIGVDRFVTTTPTRTLDTRRSFGATRPRGQGTISVQVGGRAPVPARAAKAVTMAVTVTNATRPGYLNVAVGSGTANIYFPAGRTVTNLVTANLSSTGRVTFYNGSTAPIDVIADVSGYYRATNRPRPPIVPGKIVGKVVGPSGGALSGVKVDVLYKLTDGTWAYYQRIRTGSSGRYTFVNDLQGTDYKVCFDGTAATNGRPGHGYQSACYHERSWRTVNGDPAPGSAVISVPPGSVHTVNQTLQVGGVLTGRVTAAAGGQPLSGYDVRVTGALSEQTVKTSATGVYRVQGLPTGSYSVCVDFNDYTPNPDPYMSQCRGRAGNVGWDAEHVPAGAATSAVKVYNTTTANIALDTAGAVSGTVTAATGSAPLQNVEVQVSLPSRPGEVLARVMTAADGTYHLGGLTTLPSGYRVCFFGGSTPQSSPTGGSSTTGYASECFSNVAWDGEEHDLPAGTPVAVAPGATTSAVDAALADGATLRGTVRSAGGTPLQGAGVFVFTASGQLRARNNIQSTAADGTYAIPGVAPGTYTVCFDPFYDEEQGDEFEAGLGIPGQCFDHVAWNGDYSTPAPDATAVTVSSGETRSGIDASITKEGAISGRIGDAYTGAYLSGVRVVLFSASGARLRNDYALWPYVFNWLDPTTGGYRVCFDARAANDLITSTKYASQCYPGVAWDPTSGAPAPGAALVTVSPGGTHANVDASVLPK